MSMEQIEKILYAAVEAIAEQYGFDADEAFEFMRWEAGDDPVETLFKLGGKPKAAKAPKETKANKAVDDKIAECKKNITLWTKKLNDGAVPDAEKQQQKIDKEVAKLEKLEKEASNSAENSDKEEPKEEPKKEIKKEEPKKETKKEEPKEKRIKRFSPQLSTQLKDALAAFGQTMDDSVKENFKEYIEELDDDDYKGAGLADHMRKFAMMLHEEAPAGGAVAGTLIADAAKGKTTTVTVDQLKKMEMITAVEPPGTFFNPSDGRFVKGPDADEDEDMEEVSFEGLDYVVGTKTNRVYLADDHGDVFTGGFRGVGKFAKMK